MRNSKLVVTWNCASAAAWICASAAAWAAPVQQPHLEADLISEVTEITPGQTFRTAVVLTPELGWHVYWRNPGDSGLPPSITWAAPQEFSSGPLLFEAPSRIPYQTLVNFGYPGETLLLTDWTAPSDLKPGTSVELQAKAKWLVCQNECLPGKATLTLRLKTISVEQASARSKDPKASEKIVNASLAIPRPSAAEADVILRTRTFREKESGRLWLEWSMRPQSASQPLGRRVHFFFDGKDFEPSSRQWLRPTPDGSLDLLTEAKADSRLSRLRGAMVIRNADGTLNRAFEVDQPAPALSATLTREQILQLLKDAQDQGVENAEPRGQEPHGPEGLGLMLIFGFLGGLLLNLMPCIFPVLSIKILGFMEQSSQAPGQIRKHGWVFSVGVLISFWILAGLLFGLRSAGQEIGWGFQLQSPMFVGVLSLLFFLMSLNLLGVFEIGTRWMGIGTPLSAREGYAGSFFSGVLTVVAATPCSAPLMTTALGFALSQPAWIGTLILSAIGAGLALPYWLLSQRPDWIQALPRPGRWMETFKQALAFPLLLTSLWLLWVLAAQAGTEGVIRVLGVYLLASFLIWLRSKLASTARGRGIWWVAAAALVALWAYEGWLRLKSIPIVSARSGIQTIDPHSLAWKKFSTAAVEESRRAGKPVLIDFTADWCVTCKVNERLVLNTDYLQQAFARFGVELYRADWTNGDPEITRALAAVERNSVPVYLYYAPGATQPEILPQLLSAGGIVARLEKTIQK